MLGLGQSDAQQRPSYGQAVSLEAVKKIAAASIAAARRNTWNVAVAPENLDWKCPAELFLPASAFDFNSHWADKLNLVAPGH